MTSPKQPDDPHETLFIADLHPRLGAYLAQRHARGYDAVAGRARFLIWLAQHADSGAMTDYLARAVRTPRLTAAEEAGLATRIAAGRGAKEKLAGDDALTGEARESLRRVARDGGEAADRLLEASLWQVVSLAERFNGRGVPFPDLIEEATIGLIRAVQKYDHAKGYRFSAYAAWWIRQALTRAVAGQGIDELTRTDRRMRQVLGRQPTAEELAAELDLSPSETSISPRSRDRDL